MINRPAEHLTNYNLNPFTIITETAPPGPPSPTGLFSHATMPLQKKSEKLKKSVDNYRPREYNIRVLATIAQLAEHLIRNERVVGSNPISGSKFKAVSGNPGTAFLYLWGLFMGAYLSVSCIDVHFYTLLYLE